MKMLTAMMALGFAGAAAAAEVSETRGSTQGLMTDDPAWSAGVQLGNGFGSGLTVQKLGVGTGAVNATLGVAAGSVALTADYLMLTDQHFVRKRLEPGATYNTTRAMLMPYYGVGATVGGGMAIRAPLGIQYTMLRDPFTFFGQAAIEIGRRYRKDDDVGIGVAFAVGARCLL